MKKILSLVIVIALVLSSFAGLKITSSALESSGSCGENVSYTFNVINGTGILIISGSGDMYDYSQQGTPFFNNQNINFVSVQSGVTSIGNYAFNNCMKLTQIVLPEGLKRIGENAFVQCRVLDNVVIPDSVTQIDDAAFNECVSLNNITLSNSLSAIEPYTFYNCPFSKINLASGMEYIGSYSFCGCKNLTEITIPDSVKTIQSGAFMKCSGLKELSMPCSVWIYIGEKNFLNCTNIEKITITKGNGTMRNYSDSTTNQSNTYYKYTPWYISRNSLKQIVLEEGIKSIGQYAFADCSNLSEIKIPNSVTTIGASAFKNCSGLKELTIPCSAKIANNSDVFSGTTNIEKITLAKGNGTMCNYSESTGQSDTYYQYTPWYISRNSLKEILIEKGVTNISENAFSNNTGLTRINIPAGVATIGSSAFSGCFDLAVVKLPSGIVSIEARAFADCNGLADVYYNDFEDEWINVSIGEGNECLTGARIHFMHNEHNFSIKVIEATCTHGGYTLYTCDECGLSYFEDITPVAPHSYTDVVFEPTTESRGYTSHYCEVCGFAYVDNITDILPSDMHYNVPALANISSVLTIKSDSNEYTVTSKTGDFKLNELTPDSFRVYITAANGITVYIGEQVYSKNDKIDVTVENMYFPLGNVNGDNVIDVADVSDLLKAENYGVSGSDKDLNGDGIIDIEDIVIVINPNNFNKQSVQIV